jgi:hypothetical protein
VTDRHKALLSFFALGMLDLAALVAFLARIVWSQSGEP